MRTRLIAYAAVVLVAAVMAVQGMDSDPVLCDAPSATLGEICGYTSQVIPPSEAETAILPRDTRIDKRLYSAADGAWFHVSLVVGGRSKGSIHRPELCLPTQGFQMRSPRSLVADGVEWRCVTIEKGDREPLGFAYTFFNQDGFHTASHVRRIARDVFDRGFRSRIDRWAMVTVTASTAVDGEVAAFLKALGEVVR